MLNGSSGQAPRLARLSPADYPLPRLELAQLLTPALVVFERQVRANVAAMLARMPRAARWRPHLKTTKSPRIWEILLEAGVRAFKCATVREAQCLLELLAARGIDDADLLIAYPLRGPSVGVAAALAARFSATPLSVLSEDPAHAAALPPGLGVFVDLNPGMNRTGIDAADGARIVATARAAGARFRGLHFYEGQVHDATPAERRASCHALYRRLLARVRDLSAVALACGEVITSGTPAFQYALDFPGFEGGVVAGGATLHRISPGTVVFHDERSDSLLQDLELSPAALLLTRVISYPDALTVTCDAGSKSLAAEAGDPAAFVIARPDLVARRPSEEHLPLTRGDPAQPAPAPGETLWLVPRHVCPTVNLAEQALYVRTDGTCEVIEVAARAHSLRA